MAFSAGFFVFNISAAAATAGIPIFPKACVAASEGARRVHLLADGVERVIDWCAERCIDVDFVKKPLGTYYYGAKQIYISSRLKPYNQLVILLHECGHHLIGDAEHHERFGLGYPQTDPVVTKTFRHRVACLEEELEAWHRAWKLSQRLELGLNRDDFDEVRLDCIKTYVHWALKPGPRPKEEA
jgi:hypothetical protein